MVYSPLLPSQKRALADAIGRSGIPIDEFETIEVDGDWIGLIDDTTLTFRHKPTGFTFAYGYRPGFSDPQMGEHDPGGYACEFRPGEQVPSEHEFHLGWDQLLECFVKWLELLKREVHAWLPGEYRVTPPPPTEVTAPDQQSPTTDTRADGTSASAPTITPAPPPAPKRSPLARITAFLDSEYHQRGRLWALIAFLITILLTVLFG